MSSSKGRGRKPDPWDQYFTPDWAVDLCRYSILSRYYGDLTITSILEPSAGNGSFIRGMRAHYPDAHIAGVDIDPDLGPWDGADVSFEGDFLASDVRRLSQWSLCVGNPPYTAAMDFVLECLAFCPNLIFLLRVGFLASAERRHLFDVVRPQYVGLFPNRPQFERAPKGSDSSEYVYVCWRRDRRDQPCELFWLPKVPLEVRRGDVRLFDHPDFNEPEPVRTATHWLNQCELMTVL